MPEYGWIERNSLPYPVRIKNEWGDNWLAFYEGRWRQVNIQVNRLFIVHKKERITIQIEGI